MQLLRMTRADFVKGVQVSARYPIEFVASMVGLAVIYTGVYWSNRMLVGPRLGTDPFLWSLVGYLMWYYFALVTGALSTNLQNEATEGTLEQLLLIPASPALILLARLLAVFLRGTLEIAVIFGVLTLLTGVRPAWSIVPASAVMVLCMVGLTGVGYALAGLTLLYKRVAALIGLVNLGMLIILGVVGGSDDRVVRLLTSVLPLAQGSRLMQQLLSPGTAQIPSWMAALPGLILNSLAYLIAGLLLFRLADGRARRVGIIGQF